MPNGFHGPIEKWNEISAPLFKLDDDLESFAKKHDLMLSKNTHGWPDRSLTWNSEGIRRLIQIYLEDEKKLTYNFWICATQDRSYKRYWKNKFLMKDAPISDIGKNINKLLDEGYQELESWQSIDLEFGTDLSH